MNLPSDRSSITTIFHLPASRRAQTQITVPSMRAVNTHINDLDPNVAARLDPRAVTEKECELWWALVRRWEIVHLPLLLVVVSECAQVMFRVYIGAHARE